jgi:RecB family exonuclease
MNIPNDYREVVEMLANASNNNRVMWSAKELTVNVTISGSKIAVWGGDDVKSKRGFVAFKLADQDGNLLDAWAVDELDQDYELMQKLYADAKRMAMKIPQRLALAREAIRHATRIGESTP